MPRLIDPGQGDAIGLDDLVEALDAHRLDVRDEDSFAEAGPLLARLGRNPSFLADLAIDELRARCAGQVTGNTYGGQVFLLRPANGRYVLRANFWPAADDAVTRASGPGTFFYGMAHDHNFPFLTVGYLGSGYVSDDFERDPEATIGLPGERAQLRDAGRTQLTKGTTMLYRAHRDVHRQAPPESFSVSLNILGYDPAQPWSEQYRFDVEADTIAEGLTVTPAEALVALVAQFGGGNGLDLATGFARQHPCARMRITALDALGIAESAEHPALLERAADSGGPLCPRHRPISG